MAPFFKLVSFAFIMALLTQCKHKADDHANAGFKIEPVKYRILSSTSFYPQQHATSYVGEWSYDFPFYSSELTIDNDGTFKFHDQGCTGHGYSEGKWTKYGSAILLTSFKKYSVNESPRMIEVPSHRNSSSPKHKKAPGKTEFAIDSSLFDETVTYRFLGSDTTSVYFDNVLMILENDILYQLDKNGSKTDTKFILTKNNR